MTFFSVTSTPATVIVPSVGSSRRLIQRRNVDFPEPDGPIMAITSFSNVFVQSYINFFGADCMSGWTAYAKIDQLILLPMQSLALSSTTFVGQNLGRNLVDRAKKGIRISLLMSIAATLILMLPVILFAPSLVAFFNNKPEVIRKDIQQWQKNFSLQLRFPTPQESLT